MMLLATDWHAMWTTYEWWRDIGASLIGAAASAIVAIVALGVAIQGHRLAKKIREDDDERRKAEDRRDELRQRVDFAAQARPFAEMLRQSKMLDEPEIPFDKLKTYESALSDVAITLDKREDAEHLIERIKGHFGKYSFEPGKRYTGFSLGGLWGAWRNASDDIRAYVQDKPLSQPSRMELGLDSPLANKYAESGETPPDE